MIRMTILVENEIEKDAILEALGEAEQEGTIDFGFNVSTEEVDDD